jgi:DNA polymerase III delta prime subunit
MEEFSKNCGFILTCNFKNRIIEPLHSRCSVIDFKISKSDMAKLAGQFFKRVVRILDDESIGYEQAVVAEVIKKHFPDWRRVLNELQRYSATGKIDSGVLSNFQNVSLNELIKLIKSKNFTEVRKWVAETSDSSTEIFRKLYDISAEHFTSGYVPALVLTLAKYQYQAAFAADQEVNLAACLAEIMVECEFK